MINAVSVNNQDTINLTQKEVDFWSNLNFEIVTSEYPGETPDFVIDLMGENNSFTAIYNREESIVYFSFVPEIEYGFLNSPPPGGWLKPLYKTKTTNELLKLLKVQ